MPKTKIVCTIGPASQTPEVLRELIVSGMAVARLNFSHGSHEEHGAKIALIRQTARELGKPVAILQDLCGPKIRVGRIDGQGIQLVPGQPFVLTTRTGACKLGMACVSYPHLAAEVKTGDRILLADGLMELVVQGTTDDDIVCEVITGGVLTSNKGINLPDGTIKAPSLTEKDRQDLHFGLQNDVDMVALSFVRRPEDILQVKAIIEKAGKTVPVIAKVEKHEAIVNMEAVIAAADGIMVARGDLGVEVPLENVPLIQKELIRKANMLGKPVIIATQMLRSMVESPRPTRAEATDVANGVLDGADAIMLSEETASGAYPVQAVQYMARIAKKTEERYPHGKYLDLMPRRDMSESVAHAACVLAQDLKAAAIVATSKSGATAMHIAGFRPHTKIIALSPDDAAVRRMNLSWGIIPCHLALSQDTDEMIEKAADAALETGHVQKGDIVIITAGRPIWAAGTTNMLWVKTL